MFFTPGSGGTERWTKHYVGPTPPTSPYLNVPKRGVPQGLLFGGAISVKPLPLSQLRSISIEQSMSMWEDEKTESPEENHPCEKVVVSTQSFFEGFTPIYGEMIIFD